MNNDFLKYIFPWLWFMSNDSDKQDSYGDEMSDSAMAFTLLAANIGNFILSKNGIVVPLAGIILPILSVLYGILSISHNLREFDLTRLIFGMIAMLSGILCVII